MSEAKCSTGGLTRRSFLKTTGAAAAGLGLAGATGTAIGGGMLAPAKANAEGEERKKARIILMEAEHDIYEILDEMEELIGDHEAVARLRTMHLLNESLREGNGTVVIPSAFAEGFNEGVGDLLKG